MEKIDLIIDGSREPLEEELLGYMDKSARKLWKGINDFIQEKYKTSPKMAYSKCSGKPGWNRKYKTGKISAVLFHHVQEFIDQRFVLGFSGKKPQFGDHTIKTGLYNLKAYSKILQLLFLTRLKPPFLLIFLYLNPK